MLAEHLTSRTRATPQVSFRPDGGTSVRWRRADFIAKLRVVAWLERLSDRHGGASETAPVARCPTRANSIFAGDAQREFPIDMWQGDSYNHDTQAFFNGGQTFSTASSCTALAGTGVAALVARYVAAAE